MRTIILCLIVIIGVASVMAKLRPKNGLKSEEKIRPIAEAQETEDLQLDLKSDLKNLFKNTTICIDKPICINHY